jgi:type I pantothenate kinase
MKDPTTPESSPQPIRQFVFNRAEWAALRAHTPLSLSEAELGQLRGFNEPVSLDEVAHVFLPLSRLINIHVMAARSLGSAVETGFLGRPRIAAPYVIGIAGSVAVGKSTFARLLRAVLSRWTDHSHVELVTTDGFLLPTSVLKQRGLLHRKGFPESYDMRRLISFLASAKSGAETLSAPIYSHELYDLVPGQEQRIHRPDILLFEGLNVLQTVSNASVVASDFFDFSIYIDADIDVIETWYVDRFLMLQLTAFQKPSSYFHHYKDLDRADAADVAREIWHNINLRNLTENILPTRERADLVIHKGRSHLAEELWLRRT